MEGAHDELIALISHELRTPLHAMLGWAQMLAVHERVAADEQLSRGLAIIVRNAKLQERLIDDLLDSSSLLSGCTRLSIAPLPAEAAVRAAVEGFAGAAAAKEVELRVAIEQDGQYALADGERLQQVLANLLGNALKFSPRGGVIDARVRRDGAYVIFEVEDDGPGVEEELAQRVFERFWQGRAGKEAKDGLGLGLAIARGLVELHGGTIEVTKRARGACFVVRLPSAAPGVLDSLPSPQRLELDAVLRGKRIALVADEQDGLELLRVVLERAGAMVDAYLRAEQLLSSATPFDVLIADIGLADGAPRLLGALRERGVTAPAIALTGHASPRDRLCALQAGFQMHVSKPVDGHELVVTIASALGRFLPPAR